MVEVDSGERIFLCEDEPNAITEIFLIALYRRFTICPGIRIGTAGALAVLQIDWWFRPVAFAVDQFPAYPLRILFKLIRDILGF